jgi:hypothetical protein
MMRREWKVNARLARRPHSGRPTKTVKFETWLLPLATPDEFHTAAQESSRDRSEIFLTAVEHASLMDSIVGAALTLIPDREFAFVRLAMPSLVRLPPRLLAANVFLVTETDTVSAMALRDAPGTVVISQDLRRIPSEYGQNQLSIQWTAADDCMAMPAAASAIEEQLRALGFDQVTTHSHSVIGAPASPRNSRFSGNRAPHGGLARTVTPRSGRG